MVNMRMFVQLVLMLLVYASCHSIKFERLKNETSEFHNEFLKNYYTLNGHRNFLPNDMLLMRDSAKRMFHFGYDNYMQYAYPMDELDPIHCTGRGPDIENPSNININDVLGNFSLTLVDSLDTLAIMGNTSEFKSAVQLVIANVHFDKNTTVQVFETNIRVLGSLLSAHLIITNPKQPFGDMRIENYNNELLALAHDVAVRLLPAFDSTPSGIPYPRVNLRYGVPKNSLTHTATAGAGSLLLEFGVLSRLTGDPTFENAARRSVEQIWKRRNSKTGLLGHAIDVNTGRWMGKLSGIGAGMDSFFEYLFKAYILFGEKQDLKVYEEAIRNIKQHIRRGREHCNYGSGDPPMYVNVDIHNGNMLNTWVDSLQAFLPGLLVLSGDVEEAICCHALYYTIWRRFGALPERYNWHYATADVVFYPLRPELIESTYLLYRATKNPFYLQVGREILESIELHARAQCGYASLHNVLDKSQEDRMESFFLSETCKYLYLLFDVENPLHTEQMQSVFTTEGHILPITKELRQRDWEDDFNYFYEPDDLPIAVSNNCSRVPIERTYGLPLLRDYFDQLNLMVGAAT